MIKKLSEQINQMETQASLDLPLAKEFTNDSAEKQAVGGIKYDGGKTPIYRGAISYFPRAIIELAKVSAFGASKYEWDGWRSVDDGLNRYTDALVRHLVAEGEGEVLDPDSRLLHASHVLWNAAARLELILKERDVLLLETTTDT